MKRQRLNSSHGLVAICAGLALFSGGCAGRVVLPTPATVEIPSKGIKLASRTVGGIFMFDVSVNGRGPFPFMLDTGAGLAILSPELERSLHMREISLDCNLLVEDSGGEERQERHFRQIESLQLGEVVFHTLWGMVLDAFGHLNELTGVRLEGIVGFPVFKDCLLTLYYKRKMIGVEKGRLLPGDGKDILEFRIENGVPLIEMEVMGEKVWTIVDSGSTGGIDIPAGLVTVEDFLHGPVAGRMSWGAYGFTREQVGRLKGVVRIGGHEFDNPVVSLLSENETARIGANVLRHFTITFDTRSKTVRFQRSDESAITTYSLRVLGVGFFMRGDNWSVAYVMKDTPAEEAGIQEGDDVFAVNGVSVAELGYDDIKRMEREKESVTLELAGEGGRRKVNITVVELVP